MQEAASAAIPEAAAPYSPNLLIDSLIDLSDFENEPVPVWRVVKVQAGDTLSAMFERQGFDKDDLEHILDLPEATQITRKLKPEQEIRIKASQDGSVHALYMEFSPTQELQIERATNDEAGFKAEILDREVESRVATVSGEIKGSLFADGKKAGLDEKVIHQMVSLFGWEIDFALDIQPGDHFTVIYDEQFVEGKKLQSGKIRAAEFVNNGMPYRVVLFTDKSGNSSYYTPSGENLQRAFLRTPVKFGSVTSGFNLKRMHPILDTIRAHRGVDYGAPIGTPIFASGNGKVAFVGKKSGYGNTVILQHGDRYSTLYGHLSKFESGLRAGDRVRQGEVIGYVGKSGLATGPHLHYEFRVDDVHQNPLTVKLPKALPIEAEYRKEFDQQTAPLVAQLERASRLASK
jgi:murein DD-endopeptidase MepM/ murein hydrolase activator NlpD